ncbi:hypothetical protein XENTR_v10015210 [Xenopus tropicalis]|nr:hypothetical protein XENTR_v10015210 [Xenopus tropicalis]
MLCSCSEHSVCPIVATVLSEYQVSKSRVPPVNEDNVGGPPIHSIIPESYPWGTWGDSLFNKDSRIFA